MHATGVRMRPRAGDAEPAARRAAGRLPCRSSHRMTSAVPPPTEFGARSDGQSVAPPVVLEHSRAPERMAADKVRCEACPVLCQISPGKLGACDRYGNVDGVLTRLDTVHLRRHGRAPRLVEWQARAGRAAGTARCSTRRAGVRLRHRLGHDLSRLQAGALHRRVEARRASTW